jgi:L-glyceraldehyde 3-phosphate reductase
MTYRRCGTSGLKLPALSLGAWETFGATEDESVAKACFFRAFDLGITHFDFADNYGHPPGNAELICGRILAMLPRDELIISTKAGFPMWAGPYGDGGSRKHLIASLDQSLKRLGVEYVDIFYSHRPDPDTPVEETIGALATILHHGKALYAGVSSYNADQYSAAVAAAADLGIRITIHQPYFNLLGRAIEQQLLPRAIENGCGVIAFCPLASGLLTDRYLDGEVPAGSRGAIWPGAWVRRHSVEERSRILTGLRDIAVARGQTLPQMAISWILSRPGLTSAVAGSTKVEQIEQNVAALDRLDFSDEELAAIDAISPPPAPS